MIVMDVGKNIRKSRRQRNVTQVQLANELKISRTTLSSYENDRRIPNILTVWMIADVLDICIDELVGRR